MVRRSVILATGLLVIAGLVVVSGCGGGRNIPEMKPSELEGTWIETIPPKPEPSGKTPIRTPPDVKRPTPNLRQITFNPDFTFKVVLCKPGGAVVDANKCIEGTWKFSEEEGSAFEVTKNTLDKKFQEWARPMEVDPVATLPDGTRQCTIHTMDGMVKFKPAQ